MPAVPGAEQSEAAGEQTTPDQRDVLDAEHRRHSGKKQPTGDDADLMARQNHWHQPFRLSLDQVLSQIQRAVDQEQLGGDLVEQEVGGVSEVSVGEGDGCPIEHQQTGQDSKQDLEEQLEGIRSTKAA